MTDGQAVDKPKRSKRLYIMWGAALSFIVALALFCWFFLMPFVQTREAVERCSAAESFTNWDLSTKRRIPSDWCEKAKAQIRHLGGPEKAAGRLGLYLRMPGRLAPHRRTAIAMLRECDQHGGGELVELLRHSQAEVRIRAASSLRGMRHTRKLGRSDVIGPRAVDTLIAALQDTEEIVRYEAAESLGRSGDARAVEPLIAVLQDEKFGVIAQAARSLGRLKDRRAVEPLIDVMEKRPVFGYAARALGKIGDPRAVAPLVRALKTAVHNSGVHRGASWALGQMGKPAVGPLSALLRDGDSETRKRAAFALGNIIDAQATELLKAALKDEDKEVREAARIGLYYIREAEKKEDAPK